MDFGITELRLYLHIRFFPEPGKCTKDILKLFRLIAAAFEKALPVLEKTVENDKPVIERAC